MLENLTLHKALELAITTEQLGAKYYTRVAVKFGDEPELKAIFEQLARDEQAHEAQFKQMLESVPEEEPDQKMYEQFQYLRATAVSEFFREESFTNTDAILQPADALRRALNFEKSTLQYYQAIEEVLGKSDQLTSLIEAEKQHVLALMKVIMTDSKFRSTLDTW